MGLNLNLDVFTLHESPSTKTSKINWVDVANMYNTRCAVDMAARKIVQIVTADKKVQEAVNTLLSAKSVIQLHGASESIMCIFNNANMLGNVIGMQIPTITPDNAQSVGQACCANIDQTVIDAYEKVKTFLEQVVNSVCAYFAKLGESSKQQSETIQSAITSVGEVSKLNPVEYNNEELFGYTQPIFMDRVNALQYINDNLATTGTSSEELKTLSPYLKILGYKVVDSASEGLLEQDAPGAQPIEVLPETEKEIEKEAPKPEEVLNPQPVLTGDPAEVVSTEKGDENKDQPVVKNVPAQVTEPTTVPQTQSLSVFRWTPSNILTAASAVKNVLDTTSKMEEVCPKLNDVKTKAIQAITHITSSCCEDKDGCAATIAESRNYASFLGNVIAIYNTAINELVNQVVTMLGKITSSASETGVAASSITEEDPMGVHARYEDQEPAPAPAPAEQAPAEQPAAPAVDPNKQAPAPAPAAPAEQPAAEPGVQKETGPEQPATTPTEQQPAQTNKIEEPKNVPQDKPLKTPSSGVDPNGEAKPGKAPHIEPTETPEKEQPSKKTEEFLEDIYRTRMW